MTTMQTKTWMATVSTGAAQSRSAGSDPEFEITATTADADRMGDRVMPDGLDVSHWLKSPSIMFAHDYQQIPVAVGTGVRRLGNGWRIRGRWLQGDPFADRVRNAYDQGAINAASIGFRPLDHVANKYGGRDFLKAELLEVSLVPIPANPYATRSVTAEASLKAIEQAVRARQMVRLSKGEIRLGPAPTLAGTAPGEVRIGGGTSAVALAQAFPSITRLLRPPTMKSNPLDLPPGISERDVRRMVVDGVKIALAQAVRRLRADY
jgi:HK97 family phage prohead protease